MNEVLPGEGEIHAYKITIVTLIFIVTKQGIT